MGVFGKQENNYLNYLLRIWMLIFVILKTTFKYNQH